MAWQQVRQNGGIAVVTGGASGVGFEAALHLASSGFEVMLADLDEGNLAGAKEAIERAGGVAHTQKTDVADAQAVERLAHHAFDLGHVGVLMNNAGVARPSSTWQDPDAWHKIMDVNFYGVLNGIQSFVPKMLKANRPATIINTGSKQGITTPPGNPAYNASKAALKVLTEQLAHELRSQNAQIETHLFVPGFTYTGMIAAFMPEKPDGAWTSAQTVAYLFDRIARGDFYILCPDNMVTEDIDAKRVLWNAQDIAQNRPPLSRWHPDWEQAFSSYEKS